MQLEPEPKPSLNRLVGSNEAISISIEQHHSTSLSAKPPFAI